MKLYIARHGQTDLNAQMRYQGSSDWPLNDEGLRQAQLLAERLPGDIDHIIASPLLRAQQTAQAVAGTRGLPVVTMPQFRERDYGCFEALNREDILARYAELWHAKIAQQWDAAPPGGETVREVVQRVEAGLVELQARLPGATVLLVAHGFVARAVHFLLTRLHEAEFYLEPMLGNADFLHYPEFGHWRGRPTGSSSSSPGEAVAEGL
ncbi:histidine phosphatase family protein [Caldimonas brevitalea]|uniref:phosphoglycerate mutase (2,3-diphosphoglycerate-dependent) n=1 Tax=Caldimonas brevitalea TaxID=413882 RepID=A0A0G3BTB1_9BURK|nr:histidine phosphatase family protein [Caldimonas brevitalea]AKJ31253.1 phosphoglycerate mutase family [Caldimonas brevitalea]